MYFRILDFFPGRTKVYRLNGRKGRWGEGMEAFLLTSNSAWNWMNIWSMGDLSQYHVFCQLFPENIDITDEIDLKWIAVPFPRCVFNMMAGSRSWDSFISRPKNQSDWAAWTFQTRNRFTGKGNFRNRRGFKCVRSWHSLPLYPGGGGRNTWSFSKTPNKLLKMKSWV